MNSYLRQSTASQSRALGPFVDSSNVPATGLTIANTDIKLVINGAASVNKNSGGGTHRVNGVYGVTWDATDTATIGEMEVSVYVAGALVVFATYTVLDEAQYDSLFGSALLSLDGSGNVLMALGKLSITPASGVAVEILGQGSGAGVRIVGGATGKGLEIIGGTTSGNGVHISTTNGVGLNVAAAGTVAVQLTTSAAAAALSIVGGASATAAVYILGGAGSEGLRIVGGTDADGVRVHGGGADGIGIQVRGGTAAHGMQIRGGSTNGAGVAIQTFGIPGNGIQINAVSSGIYTEGGTGPGIYAISINGGAGMALEGDSNAPGLSIITAGNADGVKILGAGTGAGIKIDAGATGKGLDIAGGATSGKAVEISTTSGIAVDIESGNSTGMIISGGTAGAGLQIFGGAGAVGSLYINGGANTPGIVVAGASSGNAHGITVAGKGTGKGIQIASGATGIGVEIAGGAAGMEISGGTGQPAVYLLGGSGAAVLDLDPQGAGTPLNLVTVEQIADAYLKRDWTAVSGEAARSALNAMRLLRNKWDIVSGILHVREEDDSTDAWTASMTTTPGAVPITGSDPT